MTTERRNITQPADWWAAFEQQASSENLTLSEWMGECCRAYIRGRELSQRQTVGRPANQPPEEG